MIRGYIGNNFSDLNEFLIDNIIIEKEVKENLKQKVSKWKKQNKLKK